MIREEDIINLSYLQYYKEFEKADKDIKILEDTKSILMRAEDTLKDKIPFEYKSGNYVQGYHTYDRSFYKKAKVEGIEEFIFLVNNFSDKEEKRIKVYAFVSDVANKLNEIGITSSHLLYVMKKLDCSITFDDSVVWASIRGKGSGTAYRVSDYIKQIDKLIEEREGKAKFGKVISELIEGITKDEIKIVNKDNKDRSTLHLRITKNEVMNQLKYLQDRGGYIDINQIVKKGIEAEYSGLVSKMIEHENTIAKLDKELQDYKNSYSVLEKEFRQKSKKK